MGSGGGGGGGVTLLSAPRTSEPPVGTDRRKLASKQLFILPHHSP